MVCADTRELYISSIFVGALAVVDMGIVCECALKDEKHFEWISL